MATIAREMDEATIRKLYRQGVISPESPGWNERCEQLVKDEDVCRHTPSVVTHVTSKCFACGLVTTAAVDSDLLRVFTQVRQGLIDAESVLSTIAIPEPMAAALRAMPVCQHSERKPVTCGESGKGRLRCAECGRVWSVSES